MTDNVTTTTFVALAAIGLIIWWILVRRDHRTPANPNSPRWEPRDWPPCEWVKCPNRGTNHVTWVRSGIRGQLCPGHRDEATTKRLAVDTWDEAS